MNEYASYLANLKEDIKVVAKEDILSDQGVLIAKSGTELNKNIYQKVFNFKLLKPLEHSIFINNQLTAKLLHQQLSELITQDPYIQSIDNKYGQDKVLMRCCLRLEKYPILLQKLTVLDMEITDVFRQSMLSAYFAYICANINQLPQRTIEEFFLAGLIHDIGLLHIDRYILTKKEVLSAEEWRKVQSHPLIGYEILKRIGAFPKTVSQAVLEHHENLDGSGYPRSKTANELGELGQLINLLDNVIVIYNKKFKPMKRSLHGVIPIIQLNLHSYLADSVSVVFKLLKDVPVSQTEKSDYDILRDLIQHVENQQHYINKIIYAIKATNESIGFRHNDKEIYSIQNIAINILLIIHSAGLEDSQNIDWSQQLEEDHQEQQALYTEIEDTRLLQEEIIYQLQSYQKSANIFVNKHPDHDATQHLTVALDSFAKTAAPQTSLILKNYWANLANK
ncbi:MAG: HD domain-containing protein [Cellvibrionaceae bacterium]|nr:HD domain-containing protein [Cellvibrionaceae bacterium]